MTSYITIEQLRTVLDEKLSPLKSEIVDLRKKVGEMTEFLDLANAMYEEIISKLKASEAQNAKVIEENKILRIAIQEMDKKVENYNQSLDDLEQYSRRECLEIRGIPLSDSEDTNEIVVELGKCMGLEIEEDDISVSHRIPNRRKDRKQNLAIIVKFVRRDSKDAYYKARNRLKDITTKDLGYDQSNKIFINENLTERRKELFWECLKFKKQENYSFIWTINGRICLRKNQESRVNVINSKDDLRKLIHG